MHCEILSLAGSLRKDPNLACDEKCEINHECIFSADDLIFPKVDIKEGPHNENIIDGTNMNLEDILKSLGSDDGRKNLPKDMLQLINDDSGET
ncbi:MAG: hypothetical protein UU02_C0024G0013 [Candidatus Woesebacteria bacterium GW2011_GWA1_40_43]|uniref:Uncharacterized protein n=1 Tax=Candidatus Woesebacteria bacterium GW2011_GWA1_40_43 TaxID=1618553 RepID=A0A0G0UUZ5_9BACT|nr:MAG: hypothetical protein UT88_C0011G0011 [Candidatus Woesebacteria bacterium GW2011_GWD2_40_19]KKR58346.1 MAG: hypothetical protein UT96_C0007G0013 [Candidatus Woesebacteria bacterium GW2011_GWC2_40_30]KKR63470.1 MAG: hypothetical protein UU02_C0024G0013 [Candidatus Woesebacteria bacterium GW2011_GWA1_40_43]HAU65238.1 hypothetical protein [Candidatus Woesebacteria bacterium]HCC08907.1 hypothetical protein [Candidatus Woesebacteria bacterium]